MAVENETIKKVKHSILTKEGERGREEREGGGGGEGGEGVRRVERGTRRGGVEGRREEGEGRKE